MQPDRRRDRPHQDHSLNEDHRDRIISIASPLVLLLLWQIAAQTGLIDQRFFPAPSKMFSTFLQLVANGSLWDNTWTTLQRLFWGTLVGGIPALLLGVAIGLSQAAESDRRPADRGHLSRAEERDLPPAPVDLRVG